MDLSDNTTSTNWNADTRGAQSDRLNLPHNALLLYVVVDVVCRIWLVDKKCYIPLHSLECNRHVRPRGFRSLPADGGRCRSNVYPVSCLVCVIQVTRSGTRLVRTLYKPKGTLPQMRIGIPRRRNRARLVFRANVRPRFFHTYNFPESS